MKKTKEITNRLIEELERTPLVQIACDKIGISRNTFYRWIKEDPELFTKVNEAISLGTGLVNDVAVSNVLSGIKSKDPMYTKFWLERKHPDFRKPYIFKIDSDDFLQYKRMLNEKEQVIRIDKEAQELSKKSDENKIAATKERLRRMQSKWFKKDDSEAKARELFEKWKKEYLKNNKP